MPIETGEKLPEATLMVVTEDGPAEMATKDLFAGKKVVVFGLPGAFTPTCSASHLPGYVVLADDIKARGVDMIACVSVNDVFVMRAWGLQQNAEQITMLADPGAALTQALGLGVDIPEFGGVRSRRYAMIVENGVVTLLNVEQPKKFEVSDAKTILEALTS